MNMGENYTFFTGFGRAFRNQDGDIVRYVGIVVPMNHQTSPPQFSH